MERVVEENVSSLALTARLPQGAARLAAGSKTIRRNYRHGDCSRHVAPCLTHALQTMRPAWQGSSRSMSREGSRLAEQALA